MKRGNSIIYLIIFLLLVIGFLSYQYLFRIYESSIKVEPQNLFADNQSTVTISIVPLNAFGWKAFFRNSPTEFEIVEGESLVERKFMNREEGKLILKAKSETGKVVIKIKTKYSLLPMIVEINVLPNFT